MHPTNGEIWLGYLLSVGLRGGVLLALAGLATLAVGRRSAGLRHLLWVAGFSALAAVTATSWMLPAWKVEVLPARPLSALSVAGDSSAAIPTRVALAPAPSAGLEKAAPVPDEGEGTMSGRLPNLLLGIWLTITFCFLLRLLLGVWGASRLMRRGIAVADSDLIALAAQMARRMGLRRPIELRLSEVRLSPMTAGLWRPMILLPMAAPGWPQDRLRSVLAHELAHVRRQDCRIQVFAQVMTALFWWNPLCWLAERRMLVERERACDDHVLADGTRPSDYAGQLLELQRQAQGQPGDICAAGATSGGGSTLAVRLEALLDGRRSHAVPPRGAAVLALGATLLLALPAACLTGAPDQAASLLVYRSEPATIETTAKVLARRLDELNLTRAQVTRQGDDRVAIELPSRPPVDLGHVRTALERKGALTMAVVDDDPAYANALATRAYADSGGRRLGIQVVRAHWRGNEDGELSVVLPYLRGPRPAMLLLLSSLPPDLQPPAGHALVLDHTDGDDLRTRLVDRRRGLTVTQVADAQVRTSSDEPDLFEVTVTLSPDDAARLRAVTAANVGKQLALELDEGVLWGAPTVRSPLSNRISVTAKGARVEAERLAATFRAGSLPSPLKLVYSSGGSAAVRLSEAEGR